MVKNIGIKQKRAVELSVNFIVMLILGLAIFSVGMYIATQVFFKARDQAKILDDDIKYAIENDLRDSSEEVTIGLIRRSVERAGNDVFGVGIANRDEAETTYKIDVSFAVYEKEEGSGSNDQTYNRIIFPTKNSAELNQITIKPHEIKIMNLPFTVPKDTPSGSYVYNVRVLKKLDTTQVGKLQKIYIDVN
ncbi:hypothetical protein HYY69_00320 [Candidatus Woesearchaeota archaeon]|nr:hypothetical protein [Candidatus Woesearchaeota archaeon]